MTATPSQSPTSRTNAAPPVNGAVNINASTVVNLRAIPLILSAGRTYNGGIYQGLTADGPASWFALGSSSAYDAQRHFDARFGMNYDQAFPTAGVAVFHFASINLDAAPTLDLTGSVRDLALVGDTGISSTLYTPSYTWNLDNLNSLTIATTNGPIDTGAPQFTSTAGSQFKFLQLYQRGSGGALKLGSLSLATASLYADASGRISLGGSDVVTADRIVMHTDANIDIVGSIGANFLQLYAGTSIDFKKKLSPAGILFAYSNLFTSQQDLIVTGGALDIGSGGINMQGLYSLGGFDNITTTGDLSAADVSVVNKLFIGGNLTTKNTQQTLSAFAIEIPKGIVFNGPAGGAGSLLNLNVSSLVIGTGGINGINLDGGNDGTLTVSAGGDGGTLNVGSSTAPAAGDVTVNAPVSATTGINDPSLTTGGNGGNVNITANGTVAVNSSVKVSDTVVSKRSSSGGNIRVDSRKTTGTAISVSSSAQLLSLLSNSAPGAGGTIKFTSAGGDINMSGTAQADRGTIELTNNGSSGVVNINNATLNASTVKARALGANGTLNIGGGSISADSTINLYAGGSNGTVNFTDNVTLSGTSVKTISGNTVTIVNGKIVTIQGNSPASVFTNIPNYTGSGGNGSTTGTFGGKGATTSPLSAGPGPGG